MIIQRFYIDNYDWQVVVLYEVGCSDTDYVIGILSQICDDKDTIETAFKNVSNGNPNTGFTYSDLSERRTLMVIGKTTSNYELISTIVHEANHLQSHIATADNIDEKGEEVCYLIGNIVKTMFEVFRKIICS